MPLVRPWSDKWRCQRARVGTAAAWPSIEARGGGGGWGGGWGARGAAGRGSQVSQHTYLKMPPSLP